MLHRLKWRILALTSTRISYIWESKKKNRRCNNLSRRRITSISIRDKITKAIPSITLKHLKAWTTITIMRKETLRSRQLVSKEISHAKHNRN